METTIVFLGGRRTMEHKMETTMAYLGKMGTFVSIIYHNILECIIR